MIISQISISSSDVIPLGLFVAVRGLNNDGLYDFINDAISCGAHCIICESVPKDIEEDPYIQVEDSLIALSSLSSNFYNPSSKIKLIGITGTNGKTSTAYYLASLFRKLNYKVGLISTIQYQIDSHTTLSTHTTPNAIVINQLLSKMVQAGCDYCVYGG